MNKNMKKYVVYSTFVDFLCSMELPKEWLCNWLHTISLHNRVMTNQKQYNVMDVFQEIRSAGILSVGNICCKYNIN